MQEIHHTVLREWLWWLYITDTKHSLMIINKCYSIDWAILDDCIIPDGPHIIVLCAVTGFLEVIM